MPSTDTCRTITGSFPWTERTEWQLPAADLHTIDWPFEQGSIDVDGAIKAIGPHMQNWRTCIQAGACIGIWPLRLAQQFRKVITFEPEDVNHECLMHNIAGIDNIEVYKTALGQDSNRRVRMGWENRYVGHCGAWQVMPGGDIPTLRIDDLRLDDVDLIYLDIEGSEYDAIVGAEATIRRCRPVIGLEQKGFDRRYNNGASPVDLLTRKFGYRVQGKANKDDVVLVPC